MAAVRLLEARSHYKAYAVCSAVRQTLQPNPSVRPSARAYAMALSQVGAQRHCEVEVARLSGSAMGQSPAWMMNALRARCR